MAKIITIDPGKSKCGLVLAEISEKKVYEAIIINSELIEGYVRNLNTVENISKIIIGNGTTSKEIRKKMDFFKKEIIILKFFIPREIFILNKNLDAISALIILEDYCEVKFVLNKNIDFKTWLK
jgi:hypothetical protein